MADNKKSFVLYSDLIHTVSKLPNEKAGELFKHILEYVNDANPTTKDLLIQIAFEPIKQSLKRDLKKWGDGSEDRIEKARKAGLASAEARRLKKLESTKSNSVVENPTKSTVSVSVSVSDSVTVNDNVSDTENVNDNNNYLLSEIKISDVEDDLKDYFEIAKAFQGLFIKNLTEKEASCVNQKNAKFGNYVTPIRLMMTNDKITKEQLTTVFKFLNSSKGEFWKPNILSTKKLRQKFQQLIMKANEKSKNGQINTHGNTGVSEEYLQRLRNNLQS